MQVAGKGDLKNRSGKGDRGVIRSSGYLVYRRSGRRGRRKKRRGIVLQDHYRGKGRGKNIGAIANVKDKTE